MLTLPGIVGGFQKFIKFAFFVYDVGHRNLSYCLCGIYSQFSSCSSVQFDLIVLGDLDTDMTHRIQSGWENWKGVSGILCDRRISLIERQGESIQDSCKTSNDVQC